MLDAHSLLSSGGVIAILIVSLIVFAESGLLVGFFLPGDTLLFAAGLAASQGELSLPLLIFCIVSAAIIGDNVGYSIGRRSGPRIFNKKDGVIFRKEYIESAEKFYERHGGKTIIIARFTPVVRTFAPVVAGATKMDRKKFFTFNVFGGILWGAGMPLLGYFAGSKIPGLDKYIEIVLVGIVALSVLIAVGHLMKDQKTRKAIFGKVKDFLSKVFLNKKIDS